MDGVNVKSEIGLLKQVVLHRPGKELLNLTPNSLEPLLFDDIPFLTVAQEEHDSFAQSLRDEGVEVLYLEDLAAEALSNEQVRDAFLQDWVQETGIHSESQQEQILNYLRSEFCDTKDLILKTIEGIGRKDIQLPSSTLADLIGSDDDLLVDPMPNLYFTRDPFANLGNGVSIHRMYSATRRRETLYLQYIYAHHPQFSGVKHYYERDAVAHIEGGDILNINETTLAVGISQRTEASAVEQLAKNIFADEESSISTILAINIPKTRAFMHLDTVFTQIDYDKFAIHPGIVAPLQIFELKPAAEGEVAINELDSSLSEILSHYVGISVELIACAGGDRIASEREQWNDGTNMLALMPGKICVYQRNEVTNELLDSRGIDLIVMPSSELSRGRGGPRCMSMPTWREDL